jgi:histidinol phosphatase-like enzyme
MAIASHKHEDFLEMCQCRKPTNQLTNKPTQQQTCTFFGHPFEYQPKKG